MEASLTEIAPASRSVINLKRESPEFYQGEIVTTQNGIVVKGTFGEIAETYVTENGIEVGGAFYE